nr:major capsid protein [Gemmatimonadales bacterium]
AAKVAIQTVLSEHMQRQMQEFMIRLNNPQASTEALRNTLFNFVDKMLLQPHYDTFEYLRGEALTTGAIDWTFNGKRLQVNYGVPAGNLFANRTGTAHYGGSASVFWADYRAALALLKGRVRAVVAHPNTINMIVSNSVNNIIVTQQDLQTGTYSIAKNVGGSNGPYIQSPDARDRTTLVGYGAEGEIITPTDPDSATLLPFIPTGKIVLIGDVVPRGFQVGLGGAVEDDTQNLAVGYTHIAPTIEGGGAMGRWADVFVPEHEPWQVVGRSVTNGLPVLEAPEKVVVLSTDMA